MFDGPIPSPSATIPAVTLETAEFLQDNAMPEQAEVVLPLAGAVLAEQPFFYAGQEAVIARFVSNARQPACCFGTRIAW